MVPAHFKGLLYGSANRWQSANAAAPPGQSDPFDPRAIWALWDAFDISTATMCVPRCPGAMPCRCTDRRRSGCLLLSSSSGVLSPKQRCSNKPGIDLGFDGMPSTLFPLYARSGTGSGSPGSAGRPRFR